MNPWTTADEIAWLSGIGAHCEHTRHLSRVAMLDRYFAGIQRRQRWDGLDVGAIMAAWVRLRAREK